MKNCDGHNIFLELRNNKLRVKYSISSGKERQDREYQELENKKERRWIW
jgi:hypothetical protein